MEILNFVNGEWIKPSAKEYSDVINPASGTVIAKTPLGSKADVGAAANAARGLESLWVAKQAEKWLNELEVDGPPTCDFTIPQTASGFGLTEAPRGALGHWLQIANSRISRYQIITPTCWNASPRDDHGKRGPIEQALIGTPVQDPGQPIEVLRVIHSFDPCLSCAVHVMEPKSRAAFPRYVPRQTVPVTAG